MNRALLLKYQPTRSISSILCTLPYRDDRRKLVPGRKALEQSRLVARRLLAVERMVSGQSTSACCRFALDSSCRIGCGGLKMEPGTWGRPERDRLELAGRMELAGRPELAGKMARMMVVGSLGPVVAGIRRRRCRLDRKGLS